LITRKQYPGLLYAPRTRRHNRTVVRMFYQYHREQGTGPLVNPMPDRRGANGERPNAHHNPLEPFAAGRRRISAEGAAPAAVEHPGRGV